MKIGLYARYIHQLPRVEMGLFFQLLQRYEPLELFVYHTMYEFVRTYEGTYPLRVFSAYEDLSAEVSVMISLGGDGTFLDVAGLVRDKNIPIIGINFGRLGFLADAHKQQLPDILDALFGRRYFIEERYLLHIDYDSQYGALFDGFPGALNDCVIRVAPSGSIIGVDAYLNGAFLTSYWGDGVIIATPTGSTGYALSCQGAVVFPGTPCLQIVPIATHNLSIRPIIVPLQAQIALKIKARESYFICHLDSRRYELPQEVALTVRKENYTIKVIKLEEKSFVDTLKQKLNWGCDMRA